MAASKKILLVDGMVLLRESLACIIRENEHMQVVAQTADGKEALRLTAKFDPDLIVMEIRLPNVDGIRLLRDLKQDKPSRKVLVLTTTTSDEAVIAALKAGADGYALKECTPEDFIRAVRAVLHGEIHMCPKLTTGLIRQALKGAGEEALPNAFRMLTDRERQILKLVAEGLRSRQIAEHLHLSVRTVETHRANLRKKLKLRTVADLTSYAIANDITYR